MCSNLFSTTLLHSSLSGHESLLPFFYCKCVTSLSSSFENHKSLVCRAISFQWRLIDCWVKVAASVWRGKVACAKSAYPFMMRCSLAYHIIWSAWFTCSKNAVLRLSLVHNTKITAQCRVMNYTWSMPCGMTCTPPPTHTPISLFVGTRGTHP